MNLTLILFLIGILGFVLNRKNIILMLISIEIMLLAITFLILVSSLNIDDILGQTYAIYIIVVAGAESAIGLGILVAFYRLFNSLVKNPRSYSSYSQCSLIFLPSILERSLNYLLSPLRGSVRSLRNLGIPRARYYYNEPLAQSKKVLTPLFISGFSDAESCFVVTVLNNTRYKIGWNVQVRFQIKLHEKDRALLLLIQNYFNNIGYISKTNDRCMVEFRVSDITSLNNIIIPHFEKYPLITNKYQDFIIFKQIVSLMTENKHTTLEGLREILEYRASLNWGLSKTLKESFPSIVPIKRIEIEGKNLSTLSSDWVTGFSAGESNFFITISGTKVWLRFSIAQDSRDIQLLKSLIEFFNCGYVAQYKKREVCEFIITKINDIIINIIPFFDQYKIEGSKYKDYVNFKEAAFLIKNKEHLTEKGLNKIIELKNSMNKND